MSGLKCIDVASNIFNNEKILLIEDLPEADAIITMWFRLLCLAGKLNSGGKLVKSDGKPYTEEMLSEIFGRKVAIVRLAIDTFERFDMIHIEDSVIAITNWEKYQKRSK